MIERAVGPLLLVALLAGCASERVVLLPPADGRDTAVVVSRNGAQILLDQPYAAIVRDAGGERQYRASQADVHQRFGTALAAMPQRPGSYVLYFEMGGDRLTEASQGLLDIIRRDIAARPASEAVVIGHTDRVGSAQANQRLSLQRAETVRAILIEAGVAPDKLETVGRGESDPLIPTADEVAEPRNRRVEISVR